MHDLRREQRHHFIENIVQELLDLRVGHVVQIAYDGFPFPAARGADPRIGIDRSGSVPRHLDLGNHLDPPVVGILHDVADLVLRIISAFREQLVPLFRRNVHVVEIAFRTEFGQLRIFFDLDTPPLIVYQMPMERIHFQPGHLVQQILDRFSALEMTAFVLHVSAPRESRRIGNHAGRYRHQAVLRRGHLAQRLQRIEQPRTGVGRSHDLLFAVRGHHGQAIRLVVVIRRHGIEFKRQFGFLGFGRIDRIDPGLFQHPGHVILIQVRFRIEINRSLPAQYGCVLESDDLDRLRQYLDRVVLRPCSVYGEQRRGNQADKKFFHKEAF